MHRVQDNLHEISEDIHRVHDKLREGDNGIELTY